MNQTTPQGENKIEEVRFYGFHTGIEAEGGLARTLETLLTVVEESLLQFDDDKHSVGDGNNLPDLYKNQYWSQQFR